MSLGEESITGDTASVRASVIERNGMTSRWNTG
jgi:hypothetical protein